MTQAIAGSYADTLRKQGRLEGKIEGKLEGKIEGERKSDILKSIKFTSVILKSMPHLVDKEVAHFVDAKVKMIKSLRKILENNTQKTAGELILKTWFTDIELDEKERKGLLKYITEYYLPKKK